MPSALGRILVTGANGNLGRRLIERLADAEAPSAPVRALVRSERAAATLRALPPHCAPEIRIVDYRDAEAMERAAQGCAGIVHLVGILKETPQTRYVEAHENVTRVLLAAANRAGCRRVVYLSILGARPDSDNRCLASKARAERMVLDDAAAGTVLRVPMVLGSDDYAARALAARARARWVPLVRGGASLEQPIDAADVVEAILSALARDDLAGEALDLAGPESLPQRALLERAAALCGRRPVVLPVPAGLVRLAARVLERLLANPPLTPDMLGVLEHDDRIDPLPACKRLGISLTPLDTTLRRTVAAARGPQ
ncbi:MAG: NAD(P)H-binding protein [Deltaproteobacteria bacterium]|nr:MAG: NAD(P)H-binding protein [Deltaproteobacteria bacterium]